MKLIEELLKHRADPNRADRAGVRKQLAIAGGGLTFEVRIAKVKVA